MKKFLPLLILLILFSAVSKAQTNTEVQKEARIAGGFGFAGATPHTASMGGYFWCQLGYQFSKKISIATEFENMGYKLPGRFPDLPSGLDKVSCYDNNFSLLFKYRLPVNSKLKISLGSGWTYTIRVNDFYVHEINGSAESIYLNRSTYDDYEIPLLLELEYPLWKTIGVEARAKYNANANDGSTYSGGLGISLRL